MSVVLAADCVIVNTPFAPPSAAGAVGVDRLHGDVALEVDFQAVLVGDPFGELFHRQLEGFAVGAPRPIEELASVSVADLLG